MTSRGIMLAANHKAIQENEKAIKSCIAESGVCVSVFGV